ncbi:VOC family protein [Streptomyces fructofermentans]|uniref:Glyoxalase n=1 Tax=Streptomyces fructofermentans TaxID=152141 RepID=A0A918N8T1_9ACTN|nr:VOC family protein [Streptomyces fructofermentans]GGX51877.1 glyoxalase [Streptomyces fructofermentans]
MTPRFDVVGLVVSDMAASLAFYRSLGLTFPEGSESAPHTEAELPGGLRLALDTEATIRSFHADWRPPTGGGRVGLAFLCDSPAEVDATYEALVAAGHRGELKPWNAEWGMRYAVVLDPDGNGVDLFARLGDPS